jgi:hypothetical protein
VRRRARYESLGEVATAKPLALGIGEGERFPHEHVVVSKPLLLARSIAARRNAGRANAGMQTETVGAFVILSSTVVTDRRRARR